MAFKFCPECGFKLDRAYKFCPECGFALSAQSAGATPRSSGAIADLADSFDVQLQAQGEAEKSYQARLKKANAHVLREEYDKAKQIYEEMLTENDLDLNAYIGLLRACSRDLTDYHGKEARGYVNVIKGIFSKEEIAAHPELGEYFSAREAAIAKKEKQDKEQEERRKRGERIEAGKSLLKSLAYKREGDEIQFGSFEQKKGVVEPLKWQIIGQNGSAVLLMSKKILFVSYFSSEPRKQSKDPYFQFTYEDSPLKRELDDFARKAFNDLQRTFVCDTFIPSLIKRGVSVTQKAWVLSYDEYNRYKSKIVFPTPTEKLKDASGDVNCMVLRNCDNEIKDFNGAFNDARPYVVTRRGEVSLILLTNFFGVAPVIKLDVGRLDAMVAEHEKLKQESTQ